MSDHALTRLLLWVVIYLVMFALGAALLLLMRHWGLR